MIGWECPRCFKIHSVFSTTCDCPPVTFISSGSSTTMIIDAPPKLKNINEPNEQAAQLVMYMQSSIALVAGLPQEQSIAAAKQCAYRCADEIKRNVNDIVKSGFLSKIDVEKHLEWWDEVKTEIEKL